MRIVSLAPGATATLRALGAAADVVGVTNHCPLERERLGGWLDPDRDRVVALDPDLVVTGDALQAEVRDALRDRGCEVHHRSPTTLAGVVESVETLGAAVGRADAGRALRRDCERRLARVAERVPGDDRPTVYCEEWPDPPMVAGNWVPAAVEAAGGDYPFRDPGERSGEVDPATVAAAEPDRAVLHYCGYGERADPDTVRDRDGWGLGDATVHVLHDDLLNQPSPELVAGVERLAAVIHGVAVE